MQSFFLLPAFFAVVVVLLWRVWRECKKEQLSGPDGKKVWIIVKNQEPWIEGFVRKLFRIIRGSACLDVYIADDSSCDCTAEILYRLGRIYPFQTMSANEERLNNGGSAAESEPAGALRFDIRGLAGRELLNAPLFCHLSHLNEGESQVLSN